MSTYDLDDEHTRHPDWVVEKRKCGFCEVIDCGCQQEPAPLLVPANIVLGEE